MTSRQSRFLQLIRRHDRIWLAKTYPLPRRWASCKRVHALIIRESQS